MLPPAQMILSVTEIRRDRDPCRLIAEQGTATAKCEFNVAKAESYKHPKPSLSHTLLIPTITCAAVKRKPFVQLNVVPVL